MVTLGIEAARAPAEAPQSDPAAVRAAVVKEVDDAIAADRAAAAADADHLVYVIEQLVEAGVRLIVGDVNAKHSS